jgi:hypothetical protein
MSSSSSTDLLKFYQQRALGNPAPPPPKLSIVHAHAEVSKTSEKLRKLAGQVPGDGGRKT